MDNEIKVNDYIRTKKGTIAKVCAYQDLRIYDENNIGVTFHSFETDKGSIADIEVSKHSSNIIDLIEKGDLINKREVVFVGKDFIDTIGYIFQKEDIEKHIKEKTLSIVTKEQFKNIEYVI